MQGEENTEHKARKNEKKIKIKKILHYVAVHNLMHTSCCQMAYLGQDIPDKQILKTVQLSQ